MFKVKKAIPTQNHVLTTAERYNMNQSKDGLIEAGKAIGEMKEYQRIVALGPTAYPNLKVGDIVVINPERYAKPVHKNDPNSIKAQDHVEIVINWPMLDINGESFLYLYDTDIELIVEGEEVEDKPEIIE